MHVPNYTATGALPRTVNTFSCTTPRHVFFLSLHQRTESKPTQECGRTDCGSVQAVPGSTYVQKRAARLAPHQCRRAPARSSSGRGDSSRPAAARVKRECGPVFVRPSVRPRAHAKPQKLSRLPARPAGVPLRPSRQPDRPTPRHVQLYVILPHRSPARQPVPHPPPSRQLALPPILTHSLTQRRPSGAINGPASARS